MNRRPTMLLIFTCALLACPAFARGPALSDLPPGLYGYEDSNARHSVYYVPNPALPSEDPFSLPEQRLPPEYIPLVESALSPSAASQPPAIPKPSKWITGRKKFGRMLQDIGSGLSGPSRTPTSDDDLPTINRSWAAPLPLMTPPPSAFGGPTTFTQFGNTDTISTPGQLPTTATQFGNTTMINRPFQMPSTVTRFGNTCTMSDPNGGLPTTMTKFGSGYTITPPFGMPSTVTPFGNSMMINTPGQMPTTFTKFGNSWMSNP